MNHSSRARHFFSLLLETNIGLRPDELLRAGVLEQLVRKRVTNGQPDIITRVNRLESKSVVIVTREKPCFLARQQPRLCSFFATGILFRMESCRDRKTGTIQHNAADLLCKRKDEITHN